MNGPAEFCLQVLDHRLRRGVFTMHDKGSLRLLRETARPIEQRRAIRMRGQTIQNGNFGPHRDRIAENAHLGGGVNQPSAKRSARLKSDDQNSIGGVWKAMAEVMLDAAEWRALKRICAGYR